MPVRRSPPSLRSPPETALLRLARIAGITLIATFAAFALALLTVRFVVFPQVESYRDDLTAALSRELGQPVEIDALETGWEGWNPKLGLTGFRVRDRAQRLELQPVELDTQKRRHLGRGFAPRHRERRGIDLPAARERETHVVAEDLLLPLLLAPAEAASDVVEPEFGQPVFETHDRILELDVADDVLRHAGAESEPELQRALAPIDLHRQRQPFAPRRHVACTCPGPFRQGVTAPLARACHRFTGLGE